MVRIFQCLLLREKGYFDTRSPFGIPLRPIAILDISFLVVCERMCWEKHENENKNIKMRKHTHTHTHNIIITSDIHSGCNRHRCVWLSV